uniref:Uncharacterized protein n=1 Tax=Rhizophora mucronata TaxID=61149 RepID=A0A2P2N8S0_RHIMU
MGRFVENAPNRRRLIVVLPIF